MVRTLRYGPITARVWSIGFEDPHGIFRIVLEDDAGHRWSTKVEVPVGPGDEPVMHRIAVWKALDWLRWAINDPDGFEASAGKFRKQWIDGVIKAAFAFGEQIIDDAWGDAVVESERLHRRPWEKKGPKDWFPGA